MSDEKQKTTKPQPDERANPDTPDPRLISHLQEADEPDPRLISWTEKAEKPENP